MSNNSLHLNFYSCILDEETDSGGALALVKSDYFKKMNVGIALDEGYASTTDDFLVFYGERQLCSKCPMY